MDYVLDGLKIELHRRWNDGNWHSAIREVNSIVESMAERVRPVSSGEKKAFDASKFYFVNCAISEDDWEKVAGAYATAESTWDGLTAVLAEGLKVTFAVNGKNNLTICSFSDRRESSTTFGACLTGGADGWYDALRVTLYKYALLLHGDLGEGEKANGARSRIV